MKHSTPRSLNGFHSLRLNHLKQPVSALRQEQPHLQGKSFSPQHGMAACFCRRLAAFVIGLALVIASGALHATTYYVSETGNDEAAGTSPETAWKTLEKVSNEGVLQTLKPGDQVLFQRGSHWHGQLVPASGEPGKPILYGAYGEGELPTIYGSVDAANAEGWTQPDPENPCIWSFGEVKERGRKPMNIDLRNGWNLHCENGAQATLKTETAAKAETETAAENGTAKTRLTVTVRKSGTATNHIQLWGTTLTPPLPKDMGLRVRARFLNADPNAHSNEVTMRELRISESASPWSNVAIAQPCVLTDQWQELEFRLVRNSSVLLAKHPLRLHWSFGTIPEGTLEVELLGMDEIDLQREYALPIDVGNVIFDHGHSKAFLANDPARKEHTCGTKKWKPEDLRQPGDYFYDPALHRVLLFSTENPAKLCSSLELALRQNAVALRGTHDAIFENLAVAYAGAHGIGGSNVARLVIRNCDLYYIGGGHQFTREDGKPVRFGNAIEFWCNAHDCLVENNRIWEVYDAALTNQGRGGEGSPSIQHHITYRNNQIRNAEYSFEYWNHAGVTHDIRFENNTCTDAGNVWSHTQRPDKNGAHLMFYQNSAETTNFVVRGNRFFKSTEVCLRMDNDWRKGLKMEGNQYWQDGDHPVVRFLVRQYYRPTEFQKYQQETGLDQSSELKKP